MLFNASVEPITHYIEQTVRPNVSRKDYKETKRTFDAMTAHLKKLWPGKAESVQSILYGAAGEMVANIKIDKFGVLRDLREYIEQLQLQLIDDGQLPTGEKLFPHLMNLSDSDNVCLPIRFSTPIVCPIPGRGYPLQISSCVALRDELKQLDEHLQVTRTFKMAQLPPFIEANAEQIAQFERMYDVDPSFWAKFGYSVLLTLNNHALKHKLPIIFHYRA